ncbi:alcohol dehydrogenase [Colletotrichum scovillei]|uniref:Alcohol dehydrogenase n=1 Tax=Colletotrichum scovillei TaxID=1209932 RepID=A0A9P7QYC6_9PEZI|nr:alcohol dehydrogenase [Colletotrichum scovillei]KAF4781518.1 alcohol dehydrogenase [Colletotrichum scovillei]KAG7045635.1 alcohol dehydrogenase [Colletotrichum scovillei]KAG7052795.1 alcohol dehydrogenase [Colletotrichum scovillei]KAG7065088.1 alcohol dehydrogenase [Colletotrichum scovillei]
MSSTPAPPAPASVSELLTLIITTSPTPSAPSTELLDAVFKSVRLHCSDLLSCRIIVVLDTYERIGDVPRLKKGQVTEKGAEEYAEYKDNVKKLVLREYDQHERPEELSQEPGEAEYGYNGRAATVTTNSATFTVSQTKDLRVSFVEPSERLGFGLAVRTALRMTKTPYVWVHQHDWTLVYDIPVGPVLDVMKTQDADEESPVKYVCLASVRMLKYAETAHAQEFPHLRTLTNKLKRSFTPESYPGAEVPLTPMFFWHDKPHIAATEHYLTRVFPTRLAIPRGAFIEDTIGHRARTQMKEQGMWSRWACWLFYPDEGRQLCLRHLDGRKWRGAEGEVTMKEVWKQANKEMKTADNE